MYDQQRAVARSYLKWRPVRGSALRLSVPTSRCARAAPPFRAAAPQRSRSRAVRVESRAVRPSNGAQNSEVPAAGQAAGNKEQTASPEALPGAGGRAAVRPILQADSNRAQHHVEIEL